MKIAIYRNDIERSVATANELTQKLLKQADQGIEFDQVNPDIVISVGGDGTLLSAFHEYDDQLETVRFIGVHTGHLGFYADWQDFELDELVDSLVHDSKESVEYPILQADLTLAGGEKRQILALNEVVLKRSFGTLETEVFINGESFERFRGDGLSVATPSGSTAYNKAIGGAIVSPSLDAMQLTEIGSINNRVFRTLGSPVILGDTDVVTLKLSENKEPVQVAYDSLNLVLKDLKQIDFTIAKQRIRFAKYRHMAFYRRVQTSFIGPEEK